MRIENYSVQRWPFIIITQTSSNKNPQMDKKMVLEYIHFIYSVYRKCANDPTSFLEHIILLNLNLTNWHNPE